MTRLGRRQEMVIVTRAVGKSRGLEGCRQAAARGGRAPSKRKGYRRWARGGLRLWCGLRSGQRFWLGLRLGDELPRCHRLRLSDRLRPGRDFPFHDWSGARGGSARRRFPRRRPLGKRPPGSLDDGLACRRLLATDPASWPRPQRRSAARPNGLRPAPRHGFRSADAAAARGGVRRTTARGGPRCSFSLGHGPFSLAG